MADHASEIDGKVAVAGEAATAEVAVEDIAKVVAATEAAAARLESESRAHAALAGQCDTLLAQLKELEERNKLALSRLAGMASSVVQSRNKAADMLDKVASDRASAEPLVQSLNATDQGQWAERLQAITAPSVPTAADLENRVKEVMRSISLQPKARYAQLQAHYPQRPTSGLSSRPASFRHGRHSSLLEQAKDGEGDLANFRALGRTKSSRILLQATTDGEAKRTVSEADLKTIRAESQELEATLSQIQGTGESWQSFLASVQAAIAETKGDIQAASATEDALVPLTSEVDDVLLELVSTESALSKLRAELEQVIGQTNEKEWEAAISGGSPRGNFETTPATAPAAASSQQQLTQDKSLSVASVPSGAVTDFADTPGPDAPAAEVEVPQLAVSQSAGAAESTVIIADEVSTSQLDTVPVPSDVKQAALDTVTTPSGDAPTEQVPALASSAVDVPVHHGSAVMPLSPDGERASLEMATETPVAADSKLLVGDNANALAAVAPPTQEAGAPTIAQRSSEEHGPKMASIPEHTVAPEDTAAPVALDNVRLQVHAAAVEEDSTKTAEVIRPTTLSPSGKPVSEQASEDERAKTSSKLRKNFSGEARPTEAPAAPPRPAQVGHTQPAPAQPRPAEIQVPTTKPKTTCCIIQ